MHVVIWKCYLLRHLHSCISGIAWKGRCKSTDIITWCNYKHEKDFSHCVLHRPNISATQVERNEGTLQWRSCLMHSDWREEPEPLLSTSHFVFFFFYYYLLFWFSRWGNLSVFPQKNKKTKQILYLFSLLSWDVGPYPPLSQKAYSFFTAVSHGSYYIFILIRSHLTVKLHNDTSSRIKTFYIFLHPWLTAEPVRCCRCTQKSHNYVSVKWNSKESSSGMFRN